MNYTKIGLIGLGVLGIILHCLVELNKLNKANKGDYRMATKEYFKLEIFSLLLSLFVVIGSSFLSSEVQYIDGTRTRLDTPRYPDDDENRLLL